MVAVVSGAGLGLFGSSVSALGGTGASGNAGVGRGNDRVFVNSATGNLVIQSQDEVLKALGLDLALIRTYNSQGLLNDDNADNWRLGVHQRVYMLSGTPNAAGSVVAKLFGDGREVLYTYDSARAMYVGTEGDGAHDTLSRDSSTGQWTWTDGSSRASETYDIDGRITASLDADGNTAAYQYTNGLLTRIQDASGQVTWFDYTGNNLAQVRVESDGTTQTLTHYTYDGQNRLTEVKVDLSPGDNSIGDNNVYVTTYAYDGSSKRIASIAQTDGTSVSFTYENVNGVYRIKTYAENDGAPVTLSANTAALTTSEPQSTTNQHNLNTGAVTPQGWTTDPTIPTLIRYAANGNAIALGKDYVNGQPRIFVRNYSAVTGAWSGPITINTVTDSQLWELALDVDDAGNAVAAWQTSNGTNNVNSTTAWVSAATYDAATQTWSSAVVLHSIPSPNTFYLRYMLTAQIRGSEVVVAYEADVFISANSYPLHTRSTTVMRRHGGVWSTAVLGVTQSPNASEDNIVVRIAPNGDLLALYVVTDSDTSGPFVPGEVFFSKLPAGSSTWNTPQLIGSRTNNQPPRETVIADFEIDDNGNGVVFWTTNSSTTLQTQRYNAATGVWTAPESLPYSEGILGGLSVDHDGRAAWAYIASGTVYVRIFDPTLNVWGAPIAVPGSNVGFLDYPMTALRNGRLAVSWSSYNSSTNVSTTFVAQRIDGAWTLSPVANGQAAIEMQMDEQGNIALGNSFYHPDGSYLIPAGATWASIAQTLYGTSAGASALQAALANPPLIAGIRLRNLPSTLSVTTTVMVAVTPYYTVSASDTWSSIAQAVYGTNDTNVVTALKNALGDPALTPGAHLTVPLSLSATPVGRITTLTYSGSGISTQTDVQGPTGQISTLITNTQGQLLSMLSPTVNGARLKQNFTYDASGNVTSIAADPDGANLRTDFEYDANGNLILSRDALGHTVTRTYNGANQLVTESTFSVADPDGGSSGQPSGAMTSRSAYDSEQHLRFTVSADGRVVEYRYDSAGNRVAVLKYTVATYDVSALSPATSLSAAALETWVAAQNLTQLERTDYAYDFRGNVSTATTYEQTNSSGAGIASTAAVTHFVYDQRGNLLQTIDARGSDYVTNFTYDGLGRLLTTSQWRSAGVVSTTVNTYDDAHRQSTTTLANGLVTTNLYDRNGRLISVAQSDSAQAYGTTTYDYDSLGRIRLTTDAAGQTQHVLYDAAGRKSATIEADGTLTEFVYDGASHLVKTVAYFNRLTAATRATLVDGSGNPAEISVATLIATLASAPGYDASLNRITRAVYDRAGQLVFAIDASGAVTQNFYDGAGRLTGTVQYATPVVINPSVNSLTPSDVVVTYMPGSGSGSGPVTASANTEVLSTTETTPHSLDSGALTTPSGGSGAWGTAALHESSGTTASDPSVAVASNGNAVSIWAEGSNLYARHYVRSTNTWTTTPIALDNLGTAVLSPKLAVDRATGDAVVAWVQNDGTAASVYVSRYTASTGTWTAPSGLESVAQAVGSGAGSIGVAISGARSVVTWLQSNGTQNDVYAAHFDGSAWSARQLVDSRSNAVTQTSVAMDLDGNYTVCWTQSNGTAASIYLNNRDWASGTWSGAILWEEYNTAGGDPIVASDGANNGFISWRIGTDLYVQRYYADIDDFGPEIVLDTLSTAIAATSMALDPASGNAVISWVQSDGTANSVHAVLYTASTDSWSAPFLLESSASAVAGTVGSVATAITGDNAVVTWLQSNGSVNDVYASRWNGSGWSSPQLLDNAATAGTQTAVAIDDLGNVTALWQQSDGTANSIYQSRFTVGGGILIVDDWANAEVPLAQDNFDRADGSLGANWLTAPVSMTPLAISNHQLLAPTGNYSEAHYTGAQYAGNQYSQITYVSDLGTGAINLIVRAQQYDASATADGYIGQAGMNGWRIIRLDNGVETELAAGAATFTPGDTLNFSASGNVLTFKQGNDVLGTVVDSTYSTGQTGIGMWNPGSLIVDDWASGEVPVAQDNFDRADGLLGSNWVNSALSSTDLLISGTQLHAPTNNYSEAIYTGTTFAADQSSQVQYVSGLGTGALNIIVRATQYDTSGSADGYIGQAGMNGWRILRLDNGTETELAAGSASFSPGDVLNFSAIGSTLRLIRNGSILGSAIDSTYTNGAPGVGMWNPSPGSLLIDQWKGANAAALILGAPPYYTVPAAATWQSVAATLYGINSAAAGAALQAAMGNPALTPGAQFTGLPATLNVLMTVPQYYVVQSGQDWEDITDDIYGTTDPNAVAQLQSAAGNPTLTTGLHLTVPLSLTYGGSGGATTSTADRSTRNFYSGDGALTATLDAGGYLVAYTYDGAGHLIRQTGYANPTPVQFRATGTLAQLSPAASANDVVSYFLYDGEGRRVGVVDAEKYLSETVYDNAGNVSNVTRYATAVNYSGSESLGSIRPSAGVNHSTTYQYDGANNLTSETDHRGMVTSHTYNSVGQIIATTVAVGTLDQRSFYMRYDSRGRIVAELTAEGVTKITSGMSQAQIDLVWTQYGVRHVYDSVGRRISSTDQNGHTTLFFYDPDGRLTHAVNALGEVIEAIYNGLGQLSQQIAYTNRISVSGLSGGAVNSTLTDRLIAATDTSKDAKTTFTYTQTGQVASSETAMGAIVTHAYNAFGEERERLDKIDGTRSLRQEFSYNTRGLLEVTRSDPNGFNTTVSAEYDAFGRAITVTDARSHSTHYEYDRLGRQIATVDAVNSRRTTSYDAFSRTLTTSDGLSNVTQYVYDDALRTTTLTTPEQVVVRTTYSLLGQVVSVTAAGNTKTYTYTANGDLETVVDNLGALESHQYDRAGRELLQVNARGVLTSIGYDAANRVLTRIVDTTGTPLTTTYTYDGQGRVTRVSEPNGRITDTTYDADSRVTLVVIDPDGLNLRTSYEYNLAGNVITVTEGVDPAKLARTRYEYDVLGRRIKEVVELERSGATVTRTSTTLYSYDANGNLSRKIDGNTAPTWYVYDAANNLRFSVDALGGVTENTYDAEGRVVGVKRYATAVSTGGFGEVISTVSVPADPARDRFTQTVYDRDGRGVYTIDPLGGVTQRTFDVNGNLTRERIFSAQVAQATYSSIAAIEGALATVGANLQQVAAADRVGWTAYDVRGQALFRVNGDYSVVRSAYDGHGNVTSTTRYANRIGAQSGSYDLATLTAWVDGGGANAAVDRTTLYWYDGLDRLRFTRDAEGYMHEIRLDDAARTEKEILHHFVSTMTAANSYAQVVAAYPSSGITDRQTTTVRDVAGRVTDVIDFNGNFDHYTYDEVGNKRTFQNKAGNVWVYDYDANHRLISETGPEIDVATVAVDGNGGLASQTSQNVHLRTQITYDELGNVKSRREGIIVVGGNEDASQSRLTRYDYDRLGRQERTLFPETQVYNYQTGTTELRTDLYSEVAYDVFGNASRNRDVAGRYSYKAYDQLGRVTHELDTDISGDSTPRHYVTARKYDAFGNVTELTRYAQTITTPAFASNRLDAAPLAASVSALNSDDRNRTLVTAYDRLDRAVYVRQPQVEVFDSQPISGGVAYSASPVTYFKYDAFGQVIRESRLVNGQGIDTANPNPDAAPGAWAHTYRYYDRRGNLTAEVDPLRYLTRYEYDTSSNLTSKKEFATALAAEPTDPFTVPNATLSSAPSGSMPGTSLPPAQGYDRVRSYGYDRLNRLTGESLTDLQYWNGSEYRRGFSSTSYEYDVLGNQTRTIVNGVSTLTFYDKLGRIIGIAQPRRLLGDSTHTPYTQLDRDVYGNLVRQVQYAADAGAISGTNPPAVAASADDRTTLFLLDTYGRAVRTQNALGAQRFAAYNVRGDVAREWQNVSNVDPVSGSALTEVISTLYYYDALGRQIRVVEPQSATQTRTAEAEYNAFGEIIRKRVLGMSAEEYFKYDNAGRVWNTNSGDGVDKLHLHDLAGNVTAEIRSQTTDLEQFASLQQALSSQAPVIRTEAVFDRAGRVVEQREPGYAVVAGNPATYVTPTRRQQLDRWGSAVSVTDSAGNNTQYRYNQFGQVIAVLQPEVEVLDTRSGQIGYEADGQGQLTVVPRRTPIAYNRYDQSGRLIAVQDARGNVNRIEYNEANQKLREINADEAAFQQSGESSRKNFFYNGFGEQILVRDERGYETRMRYDGLGQLVAMAQEISNLAFDNYATNYFPGVDPTRTDFVTYRYGYDEAGRRIWETSGEFMADNATEETTRSWYDWQGNLIRTRQPRGIVSLPTTDLGMYELRFETRYEYDVDGNKIREIDGNGSTMTWQYDHFGRLLNHSELSNTGTPYDYSSDLYGDVGDVITYQYNQAGQLLWETSAFGQNINYRYDEAGHLAGLIDRGAAHGLLFASTRDTEYSYDAYGRRIRERLVIDGTTHQDATVTYDELNRLRTVTDLRDSVQYWYDANGNRTHIAATYRDNFGAWRTQDLWYVYDAMNRVTVSQGARTTGPIPEVTINTTQGVELEYNSRGERVGMRTYGKRLQWEQWTFEDVINGGVSSGSTYSEVAGYNHEYYFYDGRGLLIDTLRERDFRQTYNGEVIFAATSSVETGTRTNDRAGRLTVEQTQTVSNGNLELRTGQLRYDDNGRLLEQRTYLFNGNTNAYDRLESVAAYGDAAYTHGYTWEVILPDGSVGYGEWPSGWSSGFDAAGVLRGYVVYVYNTNTGQLAYNTTHTFEYRLSDSYDEVKHHAQSVGGGRNGTPLPGSTTRQYNVNGELIAFRDDKATGGAQDNRIFATNAAGQVVSAVAGPYTYNPINSAAVFSSLLEHEGPGSFISSQFYRYWDGKLIGTFGLLQSEGVTFSANFDVNYEPVSDHYPTNTPSQVTVQAGDTLRAIAARIFGDGSLWYVIADANGLQVGPDAELVDQVGWSLRIPNEVLSLSNTSSSYKPFDISDALGDTTPTQPMPPPPRPQKKGCGVIGQILIIVVAIVVTWLTAGATAYAFSGSTSLAGLTTAQAVVAASVGAAAGSAASQGVAIAIGAQDSFSWKAVASAGITGGILGGTDLGALFGNNPSFGQMMLQGAVNSSVSQGVNIALGLQKSFSWKEVAISGLSSAVAGEVSQRVGEGISGTPYGDWARVGAGAAAGVASALVRRSMGGRMETDAVLADVFGNAIGNSIVDRMTPSDSDIKQGIAETRARNEAELLSTAMPTLDMNPEDTIRSGSNLSGDDARAAAFNWLTDPLPPFAPTNPGNLTSADFSLLSAADQAVSMHPVTQAFNANDPHQYLLMSFFDGTWNDRSVMPIDTNPATLEGFAENSGNNNVFSRYYEGVGTSPETKLFGGATGAGISNRVFQAYGDIVNAANRFYENDPDAQLVFGSSGFSRGATEARMFANYLEEQGIPDLSTRRESLNDAGETQVTFDRYLAEPGKARIGAMVLFDTVSTGFGSLYDLSIPSQAENVLHLTAQDEHRRFFPLVSAVDTKDPTDPRILELTLPGAHSDIGGSYDRHGLGDFNLNLAYRYLERVGIPVAPMPQTYQPNPNQFQIHDSRGWLDRVLDQIDPNTMRSIEHRRNP